MNLTELSLKELQKVMGSARERDGLPLADLYKAMNELEARQLDIRARRKLLGDEIRRRSAAQQFEAKLSVFSPDERAELAKLARDQVVTMSQGG